MARTRAQRASGYKATGGRKSAGAIQKPKPKPKVTAKQANRKMSEAKAGMARHASRLTRRNVGKLKK